MLSSNINEEEDAEPDYSTWSVKEMRDENTRSLYRERDLKQPFKLHSWSSIPTEIQNKIMAEKKIQRELLEAYNKKYRKSY